MAKITALIHTQNDEQRIGRALESLRACDEVLVIDHASTDRTADVARQHGAKVKPAVPGVDDGVYAADAGHDWILCLRPNEAISELLEATLLEWQQHFQDSSPQQLGIADACSYAFSVRQETPQGWKTSASSETRLVNRKKVNWESALPPADPKAPVLPGEILHFRNP